MQQSARSFLILTSAINASNPNPNPNSVIRDQIIKRKKKNDNNNKTIETYASELF